jgi:hypothetical protein
MPERIWLLTESGEEPIDLADMTPEMLADFGLDADPHAHDPFARLFPAETAAKSISIAPAISEDHPFLTQDELSQMRLEAMEERRNRLLAEGSNWAGGNTNMPYALLKQVCLGLVVCAS